MSNPSLSSGGGLSKDEVIKLLFGYSGVGTENGCGINYINGFLVSED